MSRILDRLRDVGRFLTARPERLLLCLAAGTVGALVAVPPTQAAFDYTWRNAEFCDDCHIHDYANEGFFRSAHAQVTTCHDCHRVPIMHYPRNLWVTATHGPLTQEEMHRPDVPTLLCATCHTEEADEEMTGPMTEALRARIVKIDESPMHRLHREARRDHAPLAGDADPDGHGQTGEISCMDCHGSETNRAHQFLPSRDTCLTCHADAAHAGGRLDTLACQECHFDGFIGR